MDCKISLKKLYQYKTNFSKTSLYGNNVQVPLSCRKDDAIDFDAVKRNFCNEEFNFRDLLKSSDALSYINEKLTFVEFKSGIVDRNDVYVKIIHSIIMLMFIFDISLDWIKKNLSFWLVYNEYKTKGRKLLGWKAKIKNELDPYNIKKIFENKYLSEVRSYDVSEFDKLSIDVKI